MIFDTDIFIWVQRGNLKAAQLIEGEDERLLSIQSYMELLQGAENRRQHELTKSFLRDFGFSTLPLSENIGHRAAVYVEEYGLSHGLRTGDAIIAATTAEHGLILCTSNAKHFSPIRDLKTKIFRP
ncbi:MAG: twitching motility protein PilT [Lentisphaerae bacterium RIFOXYC12_FULL_60_16]|nr:MAG: twitching motility protein PilT [Lentisphaerae bacterium RIFOXYC12_FULL_60_16]OGV84612.1 MAG: twitching motility protein PilT [Lentisphaerae bacterium RIFOXYB12_FULL_60_10]